MKKISIKNKNEGNKLLEELWKYFAVKGIIIRAVAIVKTIANIPPQGWANISEGRNESKMLFSFTHSIFSKLIKNDHHPAITTIGRKRKIEETDLFISRVNIIFYKNS